MVALDTLKQGDKVQFSALGILFQKWAQSTLTRDSQQTSEGVSARTPSTIKTDANT